MKADLIKYANPTYATEGEITGTSSLMSDLGIIIIGIAVTVIIICLIVSFVKLSFSWMIFRIILSALLVCYLPNAIHVITH